MPAQFSRRQILFGAIAGAWTSTSLTTFATPASAQTSGEGAQIPRSALIEPRELARLLESGDELLLIFQVGVRFLYEQAHIPGAEYIGAAESPEGLEALRHRVAKLNKSQPVVIYCGCCPWDRCPNIRPAFRELHAMGFTQVKALHIADNFGADWAAKGYPVQSVRQSTE
ncbi:MAG TPA: rhodanese-like domain-containing protein [Steroidobacteraceae bacterium]|nr:rhodanese-like domain-containing protein [Steroidobacteraceae bacterium]